MQFMSPKCYIEKWGQGIPPTPGGQCYIDKFSVSCRVFAHLSSYRINESWLAQFWECLDPVVPESAVAI